MTILLVAMPDSVHVARWLEFHKNANLRFVVFPSSPLRRAHENIIGLMEDTSEGMSQIVLPLHWRVFALFLWLLDRDIFFSNRVRALFIKRAIKRYKPHVVHIMESQNGGYPASIALSGLAANNRPKVLLTLFGSDLFWYRRFSKHENRLIELLQNVDWLAIECQRDSDIAKTLGYSGKIMEARPVTGGIPGASIAQLESLDSFQQRRKIAIKGYGGKWGRGHLAVRAICGMANELKEFEINVYSAGWKSRFWSKILALKGVRVAVFGKGKLSHNEMLKMFSESIIHIGLSRSDGLPASMLEAMSQGAFPVQSETACLDGWISSSQQGHIVEDMSPSQIGSEIHGLLKNRERLWGAQGLNLLKVKKDYRLESVSQDLEGYYENLLN